MIDCKMWVKIQVENLDCQSLKFIPKQSLIKKQIYKISFLEENQVSKSTNVLYFIIKFIQCVKIYLSISK